MFTGHLQGPQEYIFRQSYVGGMAHIICNADDITAYLATGYEGEIRVETYCRRNYKYGTWSVFERKDSVVRNACEYCFTEYEPDERIEARRRYTERQNDESFPF